MSCEQSCARITHTNVAHGIAFSYVDTHALVASRWMSAILLHVCRMRVCLCMQRHLFILGMAHSVAISVAISVYQILSFFTDDFRFFFDVIVVLFARRYASCTNMTEKQTSSDAAKYSFVGALGPSNQLFTC